MDREAFRDAALRYGLLFLISVILVAGFWFHAEFYALGLYPLLLFGGFVTFLVIVTVRALTTGSYRRLRARGSLPFSRDAGERVLSGTQTLVALPVSTPAPPAGAVANAVVASTGQVLTRVRVRDLRRRLASDVRNEEVAAAGHESVEDFRRAWAGNRRWNPDEVVLLVSFRREAAQ